MEDVSNEFIIGYALMARGQDSIREGLDCLIRDHRDEFGFKRFKVKWLGIWNYSITIPELLGTNTMMVNEKGISIVDTNDDWIVSVKFDHNLLDLRMGECDAYIVKVLSNYKKLNIPLANVEKPKGFFKKVFGGR